MKEIEKKIQKAEEREKEKEKEKEKKVIIGRKREKAMMALL